MKNQHQYYSIPDKYWHRIHFVRPRFKGNIENVLLYMANECCRIPRLPIDEYSTKYFNAIRRFPGNIDSAKKTLQNWRTEISALFEIKKQDLLKHQEWQVSFMRIKTCHSFLGFSCIPFSSLVDT